jgi:hypothetical protein
MNDNDEEFGLAFRTMVDPHATAGEFDWALGHATRQELFAAWCEIGRVISRLQTRQQVLERRREELKDEFPGIETATV